MKEAGSADALAARVETPKSHLSAIRHGARGLGDELAARMELEFDKPAGWMDQAVASADALEISQLFDALEPSRKPQAYALIIQILEFGQTGGRSSPDPPEDPALVPEKPPGRRVHAKARAK